MNELSATTLCSMPSVMKSTFLARNPNQISFFHKTNRIVNRIEMNPESNSTTGHSLPHNNWKIFEITRHRYVTVQRNTKPMCITSYKMEAKIDLKSHSYTHTHIHAYMLFSPSLRQIWRKHTETLYIPRKQQLMVMVKTSLYNSYMLLL